LKDGMTLASQSRSQTVYSYIHFKHKHTSHFMKVAQMFMKNSLQSEAVSSPSNYCCH